MRHDLDVSAQRAEYGSVKWLKRVGKGDKVHGKQPRERFENAKRRDPPTAVGWPWHIGRHKEHPLNGVRYGADVLHYPALSSGRSPRQGTRTAETLRTDVRKLAPSGAALCRPISPRRARRDSGRRVGAVLRSGGNSPAAGSAFGEDTPRKESPDYRRDIVRFTAGTRYRSGRAAGPGGCGMSSATYARGHVNRTGFRGA